MGHCGVTAPNGMLAASTREAGWESGDGFTAPLRLPAHWILLMEVQESHPQKLRLHTDPLPIFRGADGGRNKASGETRASRGKGLDS